MNSLTRHSASRVPGKKARIVTGERLWRAAFSLIELIGVLAIGLILASIIAVVTVRNIDQGVSNQEAQTLQNFATALQNSIQRSRYIPDATDWYVSVATEMGVSTNFVLYNIRNSSSPRVMMVDPSLHIGPSTVAQGVLQYQQGASGSTNPFSPRVMIVSSLQPSTPLPALGIAQGNFDALWNTPAASLPTNGTFSTFKSGYDLLVERINLAPLFAHLQLINYPTPASNLGQFTIDSSATNVVPNSSSGIDAYFIKSTGLYLLKDTNYVPPSALESKLILDRDATYYYVGQVWRSVPYVSTVYTSSQTNMAAVTLAQMISAASGMFVSSKYNNHASGGITPPVVLNDMSNFMAQYYLYTQYGTNQAVAKAWQNQVHDDMQNLFNNIQQGGCTNPP
jgi:type II secretory pathway pseudopilin PulG